MNDKDDNKIITYLMEHPGIATLVFSISCLVTRLLIEYICYRMNCSYLNYWNIKSDYLPSTQTGFIYTAIESFVQLSLCLYINSCCYKSLSKYTAYGKKIKDYRLKVKKIKKEFNDIKKHSKVRKEDEEKICNSLKNVKTEVSRLKLKIIVVCVFYILLSGVLGFVLVFGLLYYSQNNTLKLLITSGVTAAIMAIGNIFIYFCLRHQEGNSEEKDTENNKKNEISGPVINDITIKGSIVLVLMFFMVSMFAFPICIKSEIKNQKDYYVTNYDENTCVVVFSGKDDLIIKRCSIDNDIVHIDIDSFSIISKKNQEFDYMEFSNVIVEDLDK